MRFRSFAKVNLHLEVLQRRGDGFHEIRTIFQTIDLADDIELTVLDRRLRGAPLVEMEIEGQAGLPADESNLAWRSAASFLARWGRPEEGVRIRLFKRIPVGGGLGGGSANAASVLLGMCSLLERSPGMASLEEVAGGLGSDVPFFLHGGTGLGTGRGELVEALPDPEAPPLHLWLAVPRVSVSTKAVFEAHRIEPAPDRSMAGVRPASADPIAARFEAWGSLLGWNDLEPTCLRLYPEVRDVYNRLSESGALAVRLSGSGSTIFALFADRAAGEKVGDRLAGSAIWLPVKTLSRVEWRRRCGAKAFPGGS